jgi:hypothetical protein
MTDLEGRNFRLAGWIAGDLVDPLWGLLDMTLEGRDDFFPKVNHD